MLSSALQSQKENFERYNNTAQGRIRIWFGIRQIMNSTDRLLLDTRDAARQLKTGIHMVLISACLHRVAKLASVTSLVLLNSDITIKSSNSHNLLSFKFGSFN